MRGDSFSARRVDPGPKTKSISFDMKVEPAALPCRDNVVVEDCTVAPKSCLPSLEMRSPTAAGGLLPSGKTSTATKTTFHKSPLLLYATEEGNSKTRNLWTSTPPAWYDDSSFRRSKLFSAPSCQRVIETISRQNRTFDPGGSQGRLRACPFMGTWHALICGEVMRVGAAGWNYNVFLRIDASRFNAVHIAVNHWFFEARPALKMLCQKKSCRRERLEATEGTNGGHAVDGGSRLSDVRGERLLRSTVE